MRTRRRRTFLCFEDDEKKFEKVKEKAKRQAIHGLTSKPKEHHAEASGQARSHICQLPGDCVTKREKERKKEESLKCQICACERSDLSTVFLKQK